VEQEIKQEEPQDYFLILPSPDDTDLDEETQMEVRDGNSCFADFINGNLFEFVAQDEEEESPLFEFCDEQEQVDQNDPAVDIDLPQSCDVNEKLIPPLDHPDTVNNASSDLKYQCDMCGSWQTKLSILKHLKKCKRPGELAAFKATKVLHKRSAYAKNKLKFECPVCFEKLKSDYSLRYHKMRIHEKPKERNFNCQHCPKKFFFAEDVRAHEKKIHQDCQYECPVCFEKLQSYYSLRNHKMRIHEKPKERNFNCQHCPKKFFFAEDVRVHEKKIHQDCQYECPVCFEKLQSYNSLKNHKKRIHVKSSGSSLV
jgi:C2H2-type zinc finger